MKCIQKLDEEDPKCKGKKLALFECPICHKIVKRGISHGKQCYTCSVECGEKRREILKHAKFGQVPADLLEGRDRSIKRPVNRSRGKVPKECVGCGYWGLLASSIYCCRYAMITGKTHLYKDCHKDGIYTTEPQEYKEFFEECDR